MKLIDKQCFCDDGSYLDTKKGKCTFCHPTCKTCSGPSKTDCKKPCYEDRTFVKG